MKSSLLLDEAVLEYTKAELSARIGSSILKDPHDPFHSFVKQFQDVVCHDPPSVLPDRGVVHEIDLVLGIKYCVTRQWPLSKEQYDVIDDFFRTKHEAGMVRESKSPHSTPTFFFKKPNGKWRIVHAYNKLYAAITAQTSIPGRMFFKTTWLVVLCIAHSTWSMDIIDCSCDRVIFRLQQ